MNQHAQGGGSIDSGSIELMQNRRLTHDDNKGVGENLNETQPDGRGIAVNTKYWVAFTDLAAGESSIQRQTQLVTDEPLQFFYTSNFTESTISSVNPEVNDVKTAMRSQLSDFQGDLKLL